ncbi:tryptophanyl-tRNA synthetase [Halanaerobium saccharolyticum]|uniref:Tryptophan--tRNA ligase n=1 Tax=Halanaerobium saccharolyticum TaxID=43595 RepID=A0A4R7YY00_9FIRM|nr:tryptophan--tRNA ligase [Halanaerobium saccharolyticum]RAK07418.1 tryptophanyl-tRNA synthetase [Halanaerobium saccharolyticum]TDW02383.1 tryptophanyl-tRNA synthetase [Halanaerobium saccharolyticum]TDX59103.1 tryptophanyl-tRNA synthetase [Halanaerobium saccharolyticum]
MSKKKEKRILTGDRPTGKLHLGHYVGSLQNRVELQNEYDTFLIIADVQALTTNFDKPDKLSEDVRQVARDYLAAGIDPKKTTIFVQSLVPEIAELTVFYSMIVTVNQLRHNPTIKSEAEQYGYKEMSYGFLGYPVSQAADITFCRANLVPVGEDQIPHIEQTRKIVRKFNNMYGEVFPEPEALISDFPRLMGLDGKNKMSKSLNNAIYLSDSKDQVAQKIMKAKTDPARIHKDDPGHPEVCTVFHYHEAFNTEGSDEIAEKCRTGTIGCVACKKLMAEKLNDFLEPMRERRKKYLENPELVDQILIEGTEKARKEAQKTLKKVREVMKIDYFNN